MLSLNALHSQLDEELNINNVDSVFTNIYYTDLINSQRELWIRNEYNKNRSIDPNIQQELSCVELELVDPYNCCIEVPEGCKILRTKQQIPNTIEFYNKKAITSVGPTDITKKRFTIIDYNRVPYAGSSRFNRNTIYVFLYDNYLYLFSKSELTILFKYITIRGIFTDPTEAAQFTSCAGKPCWTPNDPYPLNQWMWEYMLPYLRQRLMQKQIIPLDEENNAKDDKTADNGRVS